MKITPSLAGLVLEVIALSMIFAAIISGKENSKTVFITIAAVALYFIIFHHFMIEPKKHHAAQ